MKRTTQTENKALVLAAFDTLFNKRDYVASGAARSVNARCQENVDESRS